MRTWRLRNSLNIYKQMFKISVTAAAAAAAAAAAVQKKGT
jgi:hypothetical protein